MTESKIRMMVGSEVLVTALCLVVWIPVSGGNTLWWDTQEPAYALEKAQSRQSPAVSTGDVFMVGTVTFLITLFLEAYRSQMGTLYTTNAASDNCGLNLTIQICENNNCNGRNTGGGGGKAHRRLRKTVRDLNATRIVIFEEKGDCTITQNQQNCQGSTCNQNNAGRKKREVMAGGSDFKPTFPQNNFLPSSELRVEFLTATNTAIPIIVHRFEGKMPLTDAV